MHNLVLGFLNIGSSEMILIVFAALLLFGGEKLPEIARGLGKGIRDFKDASEGVKREINNQINSYEEKREETRLTEEATKIQEETAKGELPAHPEGFAPVENTIPVSDSYFSAVEHPVSETPIDLHKRPAAGEIDATVSHEDAIQHPAEPQHESSGTTKNT
ncbi:Sec-independent protein translocase subunit TatA/TatB [Mucilaginibacter xinganensis]|uniref:Sec-independent protein translocase protein TatA n=1 Tax=Mucilaginibacter xinganensis TaxID=1234841 RepID=A0A223P1S7_9SPHI|nr:twin-arginine translocase TatA/TatE family subunit [Mucilaginibacter xinganensis]ASU36047.1 twin arginine-targeting protein translocase, TatA/E family [Mucilaginibacter xinganensis]